MALFNTINFLPTIFRTPTNQRFLGATMDQLVTDPVTVPVNGFIGRRLAPTFKVGDNYVPEPTAQRKNYQLEPSVVVKDNNKNVLFTTGYIDLLNGIANNNGSNKNHQRLFTSESYTYDGKFDYDKFVNYFNYYWLPSGPPVVAITANEVPYVEEFTVTRNTTSGGYLFTGKGTHPNNQIALARGGTYTFDINQSGFKFWIQSAPGVSGQDPNIPTINTREVFGVKNNGIDSGKIVFNVPLSTAQDFYTSMPIPDGATVDAAVNFHYTDIQNQLLSKFLSKFPTGLDGISNNVLLHNATFIFIANDQDISYWTTPAIPAGQLTAAQIASSQLSTGTVINQPVRTGIWKTNLVPTVDGSDYVIQLTPQLTMSPREKVFVRSGKTYASNQFWLDDAYRYQPVPVITAIKNYLYYQDSSNPDFVGQIKLVDNASSTIDVDHDILGKIGYTSPNGVIFTNGLKIEFDTYVTPSIYTNNKYYVEGVGTSIKLVPIDQLVVPETFGADIGIVPDYVTISRASVDLNPWTRSNRWFHKDAIIASATYTNTDADYGPNLPGRRPIIEFDPGLKLFNYGVQAKSSVDYIMLERSAQTLTLGGHYTILTVGTTDFTKFGAELNVVGTTFIANRDGTIDDGTGTTTTDAFNDIEGKITANIDGNELANGDRIIFANDYDLTIVNEVWEVVIEIINSTRYITLVKTTDDPVLADQNVLVVNGQYTGTTFRFDGTKWHQCQEKTSANQAPLFELVDSNGYSFADTTVYPSSTFTGSKLFGYAVGTGVNDSQLGFPLTYKNFNNIGDILFINYYDNLEYNSFTYIKDQQTITVAANTGYMIRSTGLTSSVQENNWILAIENTSQPQAFTKFFDGNVIAIDNIQYAFVQIDVLPADQTVVPHIKVYLNNAILAPITDYQLVQYGVYDLVILNKLPEIGDKIDVAIFSNTVSNTAYYEIPDNLNYNPLNENFTEITLGQLRTHYNKLIENTTYTLTNNIPVQDHYLRAQGGTLTQHSSPVIYSMTFLNDPTVNFVDGLNLARKEYAKFKNKFLSLCNTLNTIDHTNPVTGVDEILKNINLVKNSSFPWFYSDMVPQGNEFTSITYTVLNVRQTNYEINSIFNNTQLSNRAVLVYVNNVQQILSTDYSFSLISPEIIFSRALSIGDVITIRDYPNTDGNYVPETPSKLGLYPKFDPEIYIDDTYQTHITVVRGHDGSITPAFGDFRDDYLLELEKRIYNNIKADYATNQLNQFDVIPGRFRTTDYSSTEFNSILSQNFLTWVGVNAVDYINNTTYDANNSWTWNYSNYKDRIDNSNLQGSWRAIYNYWFDTDTPHLTPWLMIGFTDKPSWWDARYGASPYTGGNELLWQDLEAGYIWNGGSAAAYTDTRFARPGLTGFIPVDSAGNLLSPIEIPLLNLATTGQFNTAYSGADFAVGQQGPTETAWRRSSDYPYAVQLTLALTKPAKYFATQLDTSRFYTNAVTGQFANKFNQHINPTLLTVNGAKLGTEIERTSGYINWIADQIKNLGIDPIITISEYFSNLSTQLTYKVGGFTDSKILTISAEQTTPGSTGSSVIIPDTNYNIYLDKSVPVLSAVYSAVIVERTQSGFSVTGYDPASPFFTIIPSIANNKTQSVTVNDVSVQIYQDSSNTIKTIPYGTEFISVNQVSDFLISYERYLVAQGFVFTHFDQDLQQTRDWKLSVKEFLYWAQQGWTAGTIIVLNPVATRLSLTSIGAVVDKITNVSNGNKVLDQNFLPIKSNDFTILRTEDAATQNTFLINTLNGAMIAYARLNLVQFEHTIIFDNIDDFGDIIYIPSQGTRQYRLKLSGHKTGAWTGALSAPGYVYNNPVINQWYSGTDYRLGDIVEYNNFYYTATKDIAASETFNSILWTRIQKDAVQTGLLPNFGLNAQQSTRIYDIDQPPINTTFQEYSASLLGFRQRQYLTDLGISIPTQAKFYQGFIKEKGSMNSINALTKATFNNVNGNINVYEEWAFRSGLYGGITSNQYSEFILDQSVFTTDPIAFTIADTYSAANIIVDLTLDSNIYTASNTLSTVKSIYKDRADAVYMRDLPTAGYINLSDVDYTLFDINSVSSSIVTAITTGNKVWLAKNTVGTWEILRATDTNLTATTLTYMLDNYAQLTFNNTHSFVVGDIFVLQNFNPKFDQIYTVIAVSDAYNVTITISDTVPAGSNINTISPLQTLIRTLTVTGSGTVYSMMSARVADHTAFATLRDNPPLHGWIENDHIWVDTDTDGGWAVYTYQSSTWSVSRNQQAKVDINCVSRTFVYNKSNNNILAALDYIDPAKGKILNAVAKDIDYQLTQDPALYNRGTGTVNTDLHWGPDQVGKIWWNLDSLRYIDYEQDALIYRLNHWGATFPGSTIGVYQWVESTALPSAYTGKGTPLHTNDSSYSTYGYVDVTGVVKVKYYFWVSGIDTVAAGKNNSIISIANAIENPQAQGIPYAEILRNDSVALHNVTPLLTGKNTVIHLGVTAGDTTNLVHSEYSLVQEGNPQSAIPSSIQDKLIDSLAGIDRIGQVVPDPALPPSQAYGISIRPRQTMIIDRTKALLNYITLVNQYLLAYPVVERKVLTILNSSELVPTADSGTYNFTVDTYDELGYINVINRTAGFKVLVNSDRTNNGKWAIYTLDSNKSFLTIEPTVQSYKTNLYWTYADWYDSTYDPSIAPDVVVADRLELGKLTLVADDHIKVLDNGNGKFVVYHVDSALKLNLVGIESGTIQLSTTIIPGLELRQILLAMRDNIFIDDLAVDYNKIFFTVIKYILTEQKNIDWVFKTSFISATQQIRKLKEFPAYIPDNQSFYLDYINEVKPYRTVIREFIVDYVGNDSFGSDVTDFDLPPYYDANLSVYRSPNGEQSYDANLLSTTNSVYSQWYQHYNYRVTGVHVENPGTGYLFPPQITIAGGNGSGATAIATINNNGGVESINIVNPGAGYTSTPRVIINGGGTGAAATVILRNVYDGNDVGHNLVRSISTTMKFDRIDYTNSNVFVQWSEIVSNAAMYANSIIEANTIINLSDRLYRLTINNFENFNKDQFVQNGTLLFYNSNTYITTDNVVIPTYTWTANTYYELNSYISYNLGTYITTGNVYGNNFTVISANTVQVTGSVTDLKFGNLVTGGNLTLHAEGYKAYKINSTADFPITNVVSVNAADFPTAADRITAFFGNVDLKNYIDGIGYPGVTVDGNTYVGNDFDTTMQSAYTDSLGVNPSDIIVDGGQYVSTYSSHAPEELLPGRMYDALSMTVFQKENIGFRLFETMNQEPYYYRIAAANTTVLSSNLHLTDSNIKVADASVLPNPNPVSAIPGVVFVNGEKITYYKNYAFATPWVANLAVPVGTDVSYQGNAYITTANVFDVNGTFSNIAANVILLGTTNTLAQIRRAVDGTSPNVLHPINTRVVDSSLQQQIPTSISTTSTLSKDTTYQVTDVPAISYGLVLTANITANIGDVINQYDTTNSNITASMTVIENVKDFNIIPVVITGGGITGIPETFDSQGYDLNSVAGYRIASASQPTSRLKPTVPIWTSNYTYQNIFDSTVHYGYPPGSTIYYSGNLYEVVGNAAVSANTYASSFANITVNNGRITKVYDWSANVQSSTFATLANVSVGSIITNDNGQTFYATTGNVYDAGGTFGNISSNIIAYTSNVILEGAGSTTTSNPLQVGDQWWNTTNSQLYQWNGSVWQVYNPAFAGLGFDNSTPPIYVNGHQQTYYIQNAYILGTVTVDGIAAVSANSTIETGRVWYTTGIGQPASGFGLFVSTTEAANFLKASPSFTIDPGQTP